MSSPPAEEEVRRPGTDQLSDEDRMAFLASVPALARHSRAELRELADLLEDAVIPAGHRLLPEADGPQGGDDLLLLLVEGTADVPGDGTNRVIGPGAVVGGRLGIQGGVRARTTVVAYVGQTARVLRWFQAGRNDL